MRTPPKGLWWLFGPLICAVLLWAAAPACSPVPDDDVGQDDDDSGDDDDSAGARASGCESRGGGAVFAALLLPWSGRRQPTSQAASDAISGIST